MMMMMSEDGESNTPTPTTAAQKWEDKILYLAFQFNTRIWGFKPFKPALSKKEVRGFHGESYEVDEVETVCKWNIHKDGDYPVGMSLFQLDNQICMVGGETATATGKRLEELFQMVNDPAEVFRFQPSDKAYVFDPMNPPSSPGLLERIDLRLADPMHSPMVAKIKGKIYLLCLYGDHFYDFRAPGTTFVDEMEDSFKVLENTTLTCSPWPTSYYWRTLPTPPFYRKIPPGMLFEPPIRPRKMLAVVGHVLYMYADSHTYSFDTRTEEWHETKNPGLYANPQYAITLSRLITTSSGPSLKKQKTTNTGFQQEVENKDHSYSVVVRIELHYHGKPGVFVSLVNGEGIRSREQRINDALPPPCCDITGVKAIEVPEGDEGEEEDDHLNSTFCVVFPTCRGFLFLSTVRVSLLSPMVAKTSEDGSQYLSAWGDDKPKADSARFDVFLKVVVEKRNYAMDAEFGHIPFDGLFVKGGKR